MKDFLNERDGQKRTQALREKLAESADGISSRLGRRPTFMEVCGTHTVAIFRSGLRSLLPLELRLLSGPGCPVCVTDQAEIDAALALAERDCVVLTYGDMLRVPGSVSGSLAPASLMELRSKGARVEIVTSAAQSIKIARNYPESEVIFLAVGFETTAPATAATLKQAHALGLRNFSVLCLHKTVPPALRTLASRSGLNIDGFILPGNVVLVAGVRDYEFLPGELGKAAAVAGFEPEEILAALIDLSRQVETGNFRLSAYRTRDVPREGNPVAMRMMKEVFVPCNARWRGLGVIPGSGLRLGGEYSRFDALEKFGLSFMPGPEKPTGCRCGEILSGLLNPHECELFGTACTPATPVGPCMVSGEGTCGAWYRFNRVP